MPTVMLQAKQKSVALHGLALRRGPGCCPFASPSTSSFPASSHPPPTPCAPHHCRPGPQQHQVGGVAVAVNVEGDEQDQGGEDEQHLQAEMPSPSQFVCEHHLVERHVADE